GRINSLEFGVPDAVDMGTVTIAAPIHADHESVVEVGGEVGRSSVSIMMVYELHWRLDAVFLSQDLLDAASPVSVGRSARTVVGPLKPGNLRGDTAEAGRHLEEAAVQVVVALARLEPARPVLNLLG